MDTEESSVQPTTAHSEAYVGLLKGEYVSQSVSAGTDRATDLFGVFGQASPTAECAVKAQCKNVERPSGIQVPDEPLRLSIMGHLMV